MGIPLWQPPTPPPTDPILSPATSHRLAVRRRTTPSITRPRRERSSHTLYELLRSDIPPVRERLTSQIWREFNTLPQSRPGSRWRAREMVRRERERQNEEFQQQPGDENEQPQSLAPPPPPPPPPGLMNYLNYFDGLGDRDRSLSPDLTPSWAALLPDDLGFATACELWDEEDAEMLGVGIGLGAGGIEEALMEIRRRREENENGEARRVLERVGERIGAVTRMAATGTSSRLY